MKIRRIRILFIYLTLFAGSGMAAQPPQFTGLWLIEHVQNGTEEMTPVAKWTRIHADGTYESGNGWLQNSSGTWTFNREDSTFLPVEKNGLTDPFGPFKVAVEGSRMTWIRVEEGREVVISLIKTDELPKSIADRIQGLWGLKMAVEEDVDITNTMDPNGRYFIFIRWDRIYIEQMADGKRASGYWHMNGHHPELTLLPHSGDQPALSWRAVMRDDKTLELEGLSDSNRKQIITFERLSSFPQ
ncbi:hypothetical protein [Rhodohalobacter mucosus]|uniref:Lipocalin-like domain-containing protein n=1 Tax=Rhodohalobacter mucosus TaxID=2079485 RepID=A0A316TTY1_9BACT|nr:hypothetical protein [Rhodohalobacter mucosus]PWN07890.1 hypothetical protein DDZ15_02455 [Rhodohalobacter mucosus]